MKRVLLARYRRTLVRGVLTGGAAAALAGGINLVDLRGAAASEAAREHVVPSSLRRLTEAQYRATIADAFGDDIKVSGRFEPEMRVQGMLAAGSRTLGLTPGGLENYEAMARGIASQVVDADHRVRLVGCGPTAADNAGRACAVAFFDRVALRIFRRPLQTSERDVLVATSLAAERQFGDFYTGLASGLTGMLVDLPALFQIDRYVADPVRHGQRTLDAWSRASRLSYLLWNTAPDEALLGAARSGVLMTDAGLAMQVERMIASSRFRDSGRAFFDDFLQLDGFSSLSKDALLYPAFRASVPAAAREQTLRTIDQLLFVEGGDYRSLFTTRRVAMNRVLSPLYRIPYASHNWGLVELPAGDTHVGLLSQIGFLSLHSHPGRTSPTLRGKAIREIILCEEVSPPPANVNFAIVQDTSNPQFKTTRERLGAHLDDEECASCHRRTDGIGLVFERFDGAGQARETENGEGIDTTGSFDKASVADPVALGAAIGNSAKASRCLVRSAYRYAAGRPIGRGDDAFVNRLDTAFDRSGQRIAALFKAIAAAPEFYADPATIRTSFAMSGTRSK